jgi:hypothetical protein
MCDLAHVVDDVMRICIGWGLEEGDLLRRRGASSLSQVLGCLETCSEKGYDSGFISPRLRVAEQARRDVRRVGVDISGLVLNFVSLSKLQLIGRRKA